MIFFFFSYNLKCPKCKKAKMSNDIDSSITLINNKIIIIGNLNVALNITCHLNLGKFFKKEGA